MEPRHFQSQPVSLANTAGQASRISNDAEIHSATHLRKLNIGCGAFKIEGYLNLDVDPRSRPDVVHNLNEFPYPFSTASFEMIEANHILEHLNDPFEVMRELHRLLVKNGVLLIRVPHFSRGFTHAEHKRGFDVTFPYYFDSSFPGGFTGAEFSLRKMKLVWFAQPYLKKVVLGRPLYYAGRAVGSLIDLFANLSPVFCSRVWCFLVGGFEEIEFHFIRN
jgi:SAM-dependent methyltransferase